MKPIAMFTFGYDSWGIATQQLVQAVDAIEHQRDFKSPMFMDIRIRRVVRAVGFKGNTFGKLLDDDRYHWMKSLGNIAVLNRHREEVFR